MALQLDTARIEKCYKDFQNFMNWDNPAKFILQPTYENPSDEATVHEPKEPDGPYIFDIFVGVQIKYQYDFDSFLFHEFTHIYDRNTLYPVLKSGGVENPVAWYSEAHAIKIELMRAYGFNSITDVKPVSLSDTTGHINKHISLEDRILDMIDSIEKAVADKNLSLVLNFGQYFLGFILFMKSFCKYDDKTEQKLFPKEKLMIIFGEYYFKVAELVFSNDTSPESFKLCRDYSVWINLHTKTKMLNK
jgi:hypothetical protein